MTYMISPNRISREIDQIFDRMFSRSNALACNDCAEWIPRVNIKETAEKVDLVFELPGMEKSDINVKVEGDILTVSGERKAESSDHTDGVIRREIVTGVFSRSFTLPEYVGKDKVAAEYKQGLLTESLPRKEETKPKQIEVKVQ